MEPNAHSTSWRWCLLGGAVPCALGLALLLGAALPLAARAARRVADSAPAEGMVNHGPGAPVGAVRAGTPSTPAPPTPDMLPPTAPPRAAVPTITVAATRERFPAPPLPTLTASGRGDADHLPDAVPTSAAPTVASPPLTLEALPLYPWSPRGRVLDPPAPDPDVFTVVTPDDSPLVAAWMFDHWQALGLRFACSASVSPAAPGLVGYYWRDDDGRAYYYYLVPASDGGTQVGKGVNAEVGLLRYCG